MASGNRWDLGPDALNYGSSFNTPQPAATNKTMENLFDKKLNIKTESSSSAPQRAAGMQDYAWPPKAELKTEPTEFEEGELMETDPLDGMKDVESALPRVKTNGMRNKSTDFPLTNGTGGVEVDGANDWLEDPKKVSALRDLKTIALGNARLLYGSDRNRYHDIVTTHFSIGAKVQYAAYLVITVDGKTKALRKELADCPLTATRAVVAGLSRDTALLFTKYDVGDRFSGQQGVTNEHDVFDLFDERSAAGGVIYDDDTRDMDRLYHNIPRGPRGTDRAYADRDRGAGKRERLSY